MIIYKLTNKLNGMSYIGQTRRALEKRLKNHKSGQKTGTFLRKAIDKYGFESFEVSIIARAENLNELNQLEKDLIVSHGTMAPNGYNLRAGGAGEPTSKSDYREKISETLKKKGIRPPSRRGIPASEKQKESARNMPNEARWPASRSRVSKKRIKIRCKETGQIFDSLTQAAKECGANAPNICSVLKGKRPLAGGYSFEYVKEDT